MPEIGLVGLGRMGLPICANLVRAGYRVLAGDRAAPGTAEYTGQPRIRHVGGYGAGYTVKLLINLLWFGQAVATAEALLLGSASGLDLGVLRGTTSPSRSPSRWPSPTGMPCAAMGRRTGNCWASRCSKSKAASGYGTHRPRTSQMIHAR